MKTLWVTAIVGLSLVSAMDPASAQRGGRDYGYDEREYGGRGNDDDRGRQRNRGDNDDDDDDDDSRPERGRGYREEREQRFDEDEYLRCHPDVRRAVKRGDMESGEFHYRTFGRREKRGLTCATRV